MHCRHSSERYHPSGAAKPLPLTLSTPWSLRIGTQPGPQGAGRLAGLPSLLSSLAPEGPRPRIEPLLDLAELADTAPEEVGRLVLDSDSLPLQDLGYVRRYLDRGPARSLVLIGEDPGSRAARMLLAHERARFVAWPPDLEQLSQLVVMPSSASSGSTGSPESTGSTLPPLQPASVSQTSVVASDSPPMHGMDSGPLDEDDLEAIRTILAAPPGESELEPLRGEVPPARLTSTSASTPGMAPSFTDDVDDGAHEDDEVAEDHADERGEELAAFDVPAAWMTVDTHEDALEDEEELDEEELEDQRDEERAHEAAREFEAPDHMHGTAGILSPKAPPPPRYFREQIADLADIAQSIDLALRTSDADTGPIVHDVARLVQFTRTLGYLVAPPAQGHQQFDLGVLLEELVTGLVTRRANGPRCLFRPEGEIGVRSDKELLVQAFDALLFLAGACSDEHDVVRVRARAAEASELEPGAENGPVPGSLQGTTADGVAIVEIEFPAGPLEELDPERIIEPYSVRDRLPDLGPNALRAAVGILAGQGGRAQLARLGPDRLAWTIELPLAHLG